MTTIAQPLDRPVRPDHLSGTTRAHGLDRWIYVITATVFIVAILLGFIPSALGKIAAVQAHQRPPFPLVLHFHAVLMGAFMLLLLAQTVMVATGRVAHHRKLGVAGGLIGAALVVVGFVLAPTIYHSLWDTAQAAPNPQAKQALEAALRNVENILLLQLEVGILFPLILFIGLRAREANPGLHKRMMILAIVPALSAGLDRIPWLYSSLPDGSPLTAELYPVLAVAPMVLWDVIRNRGVHPAYAIWAAVSAPVVLGVFLAWDTPWWHATARTIMGV